MALVSSRAIVFRTLKYSENSIICDLLTESHGLRSFIVSSTKANRSMTNLMQVMNILDIIFYESNPDKIQRVKECHLHHFYHKISNDMIRTGVGTFMIELSRNTIKELEENQGLFAFLIEWFVRLDDSEQNIPDYHLRFMLELSKFSGFSPHSNYKPIDRPYFDMLSGSFIPMQYDFVHVLDEEESLMMHEILLNTAEAQSRRFDFGERNKLLDILLKYFFLHVPSFKPIKSLDILRLVMQ